ncbi:fused isobutyryl-CoA mutase/GTPase IcmF [Amycolatopsis sp. FDAARGOS 1241]|uniref:fused isobutyryl-CoA mutase/GTPase IcmF n=1 Tax=Amycolatopsis sp. FDAARGOS 1241 TaxID=2778070 RepID=UPI001950FFAE|nr:fused isobutyryl-CoA mutase/GTPase IcmF [Amycolatopsis sp. FDAARGOS 1241]QRP44010.1 methylmalonyl-CoA mutase family protein [Amycolatopsis sp. FDAARGOS 1241]
MSSDLYRPENPVRFVTASSLFDGHDASINIMRRILQSQGAEVVHLGHNRSVDEVATAAITEDVQGVAISAYQGGHVEYFSYLVELLRERGAGHIKVFGGGGGVIVREEIDLLHSRGVARIFSPEDGYEMGLPGMINSMIKACDVDLAAQPPASVDKLLSGDVPALARVITQLQREKLTDEWLTAITEAANKREVPVLGITGTGGSGKSSLTDELIRRFRLDQEDKLRIAVLAVDPSRRKGGGALLGDRIRMNCLAPGGLGAAPVYFRSLATRTTSGEIPIGLRESILACKAAGYDLVIVETPGIGQGDAGIVDYVDESLYVMTPEFGAASQLEKIDMLDFADVVAINKFERRGAEDARRDVARQLVRNREAFSEGPEDMPVYGTSAAKFNDDGVTALYQHLRDQLAERGLSVSAGTLPAVEGKVSTDASTIIPGNRVRYLSEIADTVRGYHDQTAKQVAAVRKREHLAAAKAALSELDTADASTDAIDGLLAAAESDVDGESTKLLERFHELAEEYRGDELVVKVRDRELRTQLWRDTLSGNRIPRVALPRYTEPGELLSFLRRENLPGYFPYTAGVFPFKRDGEDPARMFAGEGDAYRTNRRFKLLSADSEAKRLSTAFDSVTLYGHDPDTRPDIYGKVGTSGVSIASIEDMKVLYDGFDLTAPNTSVSMTINGPAPTILAFFLNTAIDQKLDAFRAEHGREPSDAEAAELREWALKNVRGTVQADILKEDQGQNTCIFSTEFSLRMMADIQEWFIEHGVRNFYSVSISGYHIAEAGANPISQLAFTLSNGFTYVESYLARGMDIDDFAPNLSFFFSNGMDAEYSVLGRVARRIWAVAMRERYGANERSQKLKYHVQTSGRSLHAQEMSFNDIRTTLQALCALYDNANSLHTNAYDEAITTPSESSVRRAMAIQMIINKEWGLSKNENPLQGSFVIDELTDLVEEAVLAEFDRISERGGVLGAMETGYQRGKIQDESILYERKKHDGSLPIVGVNTFRNPRAADDEVEVELARATEDEKKSQLDRLADFQHRHQEEAQQALKALREAATRGGNLFGVLVDAARVCTLGQITEAFFEVGGQYRRNV